MNVKIIAVFVLWFMNVFGVYGVESNTDEVIHATVLKNDLNSIINEQFSKEEHAYKLVGDVLKRIVNDFFVNNDQLALCAGVKKKLLKDYSEYISLININFLNDEQYKIYRNDFAMGMSYLENKKKSLSYLTDSEHELYKNNILNYLADAKSNLITVLNGCKAISISSELNRIICMRSIDMFTFGDLYPNHVQDYQYNRKWVYDEDNVEGKMVYSLVYMRLMRLLSNQCYGDINTIDNVFLMDQVALRKIEKKSIIKTYTDMGIKLEAWFNSHAVDGIYYYDSASCIPPYHVMRVSTLSSLQKNVSKDTRLSPYRQIVRLKK